ncbi:MAG: response regulator transcription factor [Chloroflexi bacterium]|nr:response regulator transcription factor [Chloroflexota bacterium]
MAKIRLLIVDDHEIVRLGLRTLLESKPWFEVVGEAGSVADAVIGAARTQPDVVIMDVRLPDGSGIAACRDIRSSNPQVKVIMLTAYSDEAAVLSSIIAGASAYVLKQGEGKAIVEAVSCVARGDCLLDPAVTRVVLNRIRGESPPSARDALSCLTSQERRTLSLIAEGKTNKEIGQAMFLSEKTVKHYVSNILDKLNLSRRSQAAALMAQLKDPSGSS